MDGYVNIERAAELLAYISPISENDKSKARVILGHFGVETKDEPVGFGKPRKLYAEVQVRRVAEMRL